MDEPANRLSTSPAWISGAALAHIDSQASHHLDLPAIATIGCHQGIRYEEFTQNIVTFMQVLRMVNFFSPSGKVSATL
jgi:hypothetical protein